MKKIESLAELNKLCQKPNYKTVGNWMVRHFERDAALYLTWVLLHTPVTANQVTVAAILVGISSGFFMALGGGLGFLIGALLLQFWYLLDHVDGQIARYYKKTSPDGLFFDYMMHHIINFVPFFSLGWAGWYLTGEVLFIFLGFIASISTELIAILNDCRSKAILSSVMGLNGFVNIQNAKKTDLEKTVQISFARRVFSFLHKSAEGHVVMNVLTVFAIVYWLFERSEFIEIFFLIVLVYYAIIPTFVWAAKMLYFVRRGAVGEELRKNFITAPNQNTQTSQVR